MGNEKEKRLDLRYPANTPTWKIRYDYYMEVANDAEKAGNKLKAKRYRAKAEATFKGAGGTEFKI